MTTPQGKYDIFSVQVGNTERSAAEIIKHIRNNSTLPIVHITTAGPASPAGQITLDIQLPSGSAEEDAVRKDLNSYADCMYQAESVKKK